MLRKTLILATLYIFMLLLSACGQTGSLYLPQPEQQAAVSNH